MTKILLSTLLLTYLLYGLDLHNIEALNDWEVLQNEPVNISWQLYDGYPISRAETILDHSIETVSLAVQDLDHYPDIFNRVSKTNRLESNIVQIILDMPFPFDGRDYIVQYTIENQNDQWVFAFNSVKHPDAILDSKHVRLPHAAGIWILTKISETQTKIIYAWNGELLGNFPEFGLTRAWVTQGTEVLNWLDEALKKRKNS